MFARKSSHNTTPLSPSFSMSTYIFMLNALFLFDKALGFNSGSRNDRSVYFFDEQRDNDYRFTATNPDFYQLIQRLQQGLCGADTNIKNNEQSANFIEISSWAFGGKFYRGTTGVSNTTFEDCITSNANNLEQQNQKFVNSLITGFGVIGGVIVLCGLTALIGTYFVDRNRTNTVSSYNEVPSSDADTSSNDDHQISIEEVRSHSFS